MGQREGLRVIVVGAGPAGALCALMLSRRGAAVTLLEQREDFLTGIRRSEGRSINLSLSPRGVGVLARAGVEVEGWGCAVPMRGRVLHGADGRQRAIGYGRFEWCNQSVERGELNARLLSRACEEGAAVRFGVRCAGCDPVAGEVTIFEGGVESRERAELIVVADGARSAAREALERGGWLRSAARVASLGYKELTLGERGRWFPFEPEAIHIWPRRGFFMVALPNRDGTFRATLVLPRAGSGMSFEAIGGDQIEEFFGREFSDAAAHAGELAREYEANPVGRIALVETSSYAAGRVALVGDAAHAMAPFLGQGVNAAFEDVEALMEALEGVCWCVEEGVSRYAARRQPEGEAASQLSMQNYDELARRESSKLTVLGKQLRVRGHGLLPGMIDPPTVVMVNFLGMSYAEVLARQGFCKLSKIFRV